MVKLFDDLLHVAILGPLWVARYGRGRVFVGMRTFKCPAAYDIKNSIINNMGGKHAESFFLPGESVFPLSNHDRFPKV